MSQHIHIYLAERLDRVRVSIANSGDGDKGPPEGDWDAGKGAHTAVRPNIDVESFVVDTALGVPEQY